MSIVKPDDHKEDVSLLFSEVDVEKKGIIHIGAHKGQEVALYLELGFKKIMLIEANPEWVSFLQDKFKAQTEVTIIDKAISDTSGIIDFHIHTSQSGSTEPASILQMKEFNKIVTSLNTPETIKVPVVRLEELFNHGVHNINDYNFLSVDVQGAELQVLKGCESIMSKFDAIICEVNLIELYEGGVLEEEISDYLAANTFEKTKCVYHELYKDDHRFPAWGECIFLKKGS